MRIRKHKDLLPIIQILRTLQLQNFFELSEPPMTIIMDNSQLRGAFTSTARVSEIVRHDMFATEATLGDDNTLWKTMTGCIRVVAHTYAMTEPSKPIQVIELEIREVWYLFILAAMSIDAHHPAQDRLTRLVLWAQELGVIKRSTKTSEGDELVVEEAVTSDGRIWVDLPFMVHHVQKGWKNVMSPSTLPNQRCNLAAGIARLAGLGVRNEAFSECGLDIMRQALETPRSDDPTSGHKSCHGTEEGTSLSLSELLPVVQIWLHFAGDKLLRLCVSDHRDTDPTWNTVNSPIGTLARDAAVDSQGFSLARFLFWKKRLQDLKEAEDWAGKDAGTACSNIIIMVWNTFFGLR